VPDAGVLVSSMLADGVWFAHFGRPLKMWRLSLDGPPVLPAVEPDRGEPVAPSPMLFTAQGSFSPAVRERVAAAALGQLAPGPALEARVRAQMHKADAVGLWADALMLGPTMSGLALECFERARSLAPTNAAITRNHAQLLLALGRYRDALALDDGGDRAYALPFAVARYALAMVSEARETVNGVLSALAPSDHDRVPCEAFVAFLDAAYGQGSDRTRVGRRARALESALELQRAGDARGAIAAADRACVWRPRELSSMAILAQLWMEISPSAPVERLRRRLAMLAFAGGDFGAFAPLVVPGRPLDAYPIDQARDGVRRTIDQTNGG